MAELLAAVEVTHASHGMGRIAGQRLVEATFGVVYMVLCSMAVAAGRRRPAQGRIPEGQKKKKKNSAAPSAQYVGGHRRIARNGGARR